MSQLRRPNMAARQLDTRCFRGGVAAAGCELSRVEVAFDSCRGRFTYDLFFIFIFQIKSTTISPTTAMAYLLSGHPDSRLVTTTEGELRSLNTNKETAQRENLRLQIQLKKMQGDIARLEEAQQSRDGEIAELKAEIERKESVIQKLTNQKRGKRRKNKG